MTTDNHIDLVKHLIKLLKRPNFKQLVIYNIDDDKYFDVHLVGHDGDEGNVMIAFSPSGTNHCPHCAEEAND